MAGYLTTHVLDTASGLPAAGLKIALYRIEGDRHIHIRDTETNEDGRTDTPILPADEFATGEYELIFHAGDYLQEIGQPGGFLNRIPLRFGMDSDAHYHVPLLLSPFGYSTYRGS